MRLLRSVIVFILTAIVCLSFSYATDIKVFFSPNGGCLDAVIYEIDNAKKSIDAAVYAFTSRPIAQALIRAKERGVKVRVVVDEKTALKGKFSKYKFLLKKGIRVKLVSGRERVGIKGLMHNKFAIIDGKTVITGSFNWTASADYLNYENLLIIKSPELARIYECEFEKLYLNKNTCHFSKLGSEEIIPGTLSDEVISASNCAILSSYKARFITVAGKVEEVVSKGKWSVIKSGCLQVWIYKKAAPKKYDRYFKASGFLKLENGINVIKVWRRENITISSRPFL